MLPWPLPGKRGGHVPAATRAIVHRSVYREFVDKGADRYRSVRVGMASDE